MAQKINPNFPVLSYFTLTQMAGSNNGHPHLVPLLAEIESDINDPQNKDPKGGHRLWKIKSISHASSADGGPPVGVGGVPGHTGQYWHSAIVIFEFI